MQKKFKAQYGETSAAYTKRKLEEEEEVATKKKKANEKEEGDKDKEKDEGSEAAGTSKDYSATRVRASWPQRHHEFTGMHNEEL